MANPVSREVQRRLQNQHLLHFYHIALLLCRCATKRARGNTIANCSVPKNSGGEGGIRTPGSLSATAVFKTARFDRSRTSPRSCQQSSNTAPGNKLAAG